jgi:hypothetical protein
MNDADSLFRGTSPVDSIFGLHGSDENTLSAAFAYGLTASSQLRMSVLKHLGIMPSQDLTKVSIHIQTARKDQGITDVEIRIPGHALIVFEAKIGSHLPRIDQLRKYANICRERRWQYSCLVALTKTDQANAVPPGQWSRLMVPVRIRSWRWVAAMVKRAIDEERQTAARYVLNQLAIFLEDFVGAERAYSNLVYVVSLGSGHPKRWELSWIDIVKKYRRYFYPFGTKNWPTPPNYIGFRYGGRLQSIHHIEKFEVIADLRKVFPGSRRGENWGPMYLFHLGPAIYPAHVVKAGPRILRSARVWCMLDTLLTSKTVSKALEITKKRRREFEIDKSSA